MENQSIDGNTDTASSTESTQRTATETSSTSKPDARAAVAKVLESYKPQQGEDGKADSSPAEGEEKAGDVSKVNETSEEGQTQGANEDGTQQGEAQTEQDDSKVEEREGFIPRERFDEVNTRMKSYEQDATQWRQVSDYLVQNNCTQEEFNAAISFLALSKSDPKKAKEFLDPIYQRLQADTGEQLPDDLKKLVADEIIPEAVARAWAKDRAQGRLAEAQKQRTAEQAMAAQQANARQAIATAVNTWSASVRAKDPSYKPKAKPTDQDGLYEMVQAKFNHYWNTVQMNTVDDVVAHYDKAYHDVVGYAKRLNTPRSTKKTLPSTTSSKTNGDEAPPDISKPGWSKNAVQKAMAAHGG